MSRLNDLYENAKETIGKHEDPFAESWLIENDVSASEIFSLADTIYIKLNIADAYSGKANKK